MPNSVGLIRQHGANIGGSYSEGPAFIRHGLTIGIVGRCGSRVHLAFDLDALALGHRRHSRRAEKARDVLRLFTCDLRFGPGRCRHTPLEGRIVLLCFGRGWWLSPWRLRRLLRSLLLDDGVDGLCQVLLGCCCASDGRGEDVVDVIGELRAYRGNSRRRGDLLFEL